MSLRNELERLVELAKDGVLLNEGAADTAVRELMQLYDEAAYLTNNRIAALVGRYAEENNLTPELAQQYLSGYEYRTWQYSLEKYLENISVEGRGSKLEFELNTLAMKSRITREEQLLGDIYLHMADLAGEAGKGLREALARVYRTNYQYGMYGVQNSMGLGFKIAKIDERQLLRILNTPWHTRTFSKNIWEKTDLLAVHLKRELTIGFMQGSSVQHMAKQINDVFNTGRYNAMRLVRTECKYFANKGEYEGYKENGIEKFRVIGGSEGAHNCDCAKMIAGSPYSMQDNSAEDYLPPYHPNCLCIIVADFEKSMFDRRPDVVPLRDNPDFQKWAERFAG